MAAAAPAELPSVATLTVQKRKIKAEMHAWELAYQEKNGGLVPTHQDKKESPRYHELKARARKVEAALVLSKAESKAERAAEDAADTQAARALQFAGRQNYKGNKELGHRDSGWNLVGEEYDMAQVGGAQNLFEEVVSVTPFHIIQMAVVTAVPVMVFCSMFSFMGFGSINFAFLKCFVNFYKTTSGFAVCLLLLLFLFDASQWESKFLAGLRTFLYSLVGLCLALALVMAAEHYPYVPLFLFFVLLPTIWYRMLKRFQRQNLATTTFLLALSYALFFLVAVGVAAWVGWVFSGHTWSHAEPNDNVYFWMHNMRCCGDRPGNWTLDEGATAPPPSAPPAARSIGGYLSESKACLASNVDRVSALLAGGEKNRTFDPSCYVPPTRGERQVCLSVLLLWMTPFVLAMVALFVAIICCFLGKALQADQRSRSNLGLAPRVFVFTVLIGLIGCWIAASIAGSNAKMSRLVMLGSLVIAAVMGVALERIYGWRELMRMVMRSNSMMRKMMQFMMMSDWTKALAVWLMAPWFVLLLALSALNQRVRVHLRRVMMLDKERKLILTKNVHERLKRIQSWNWTVVLRRVVLIGFFYLCAQARPATSPRPTPAAAPHCLRLPCLLHSSTPCPPGLPLGRCS